MHLHIEFFVEDLERSRDFYTAVMGFSVVRQKADGFTELNLGAATVAINDHRILHTDHPTRPALGERIGKGVEVVLVTDSLQEVYDHVRASGWPISTALTEQPWGMSDFRIVDPDGIYIRVTASKIAEL
jgi:catechol 2,3-dioxygenase-like lactoylglutathione lyase family enzyme